MSYGGNDNSEYVEGNRGDANYIDSNPTRGEHAGKGGTMDKIKDAMGMGSKKSGDNTSYNDSTNTNTDSYGSSDTRDKYSSGDNYGSGNTDTYGSGQTGRDTTDTFGTSGRDTSDTSDTYGSSRRDNTDTFGSSGNTDTYGSGNTTSQFGVGNNTSSFTDQTIGSTKGGDAFANKAYDGQRTIDDFTSGTGTGASNLTSRTGDDSYGQGNTYGSGRDTSDTYGSARGTSDTYGSTGRDTSDTYGSSGRDTSDTYGSRGDDYDESGKQHHKKEGMMDKVKDKMGMRTNADAYDQDRNTHGVDSQNY